MHWQEHKIQRLRNRRRILEFQDFKDRILMELKDFYGQDAYVEVLDVHTDNGAGYDGLSIRFVAQWYNPVPLISLNKLYQAYEGGNFSMAECIGKIVDFREKNKNVKEAQSMAEKICQWERVKEKIYPVLLHTENNKELLEDLVSYSLLDLSVIYVFRDMISEGFTCKVQINKYLFEKYGISKEHLHKQAISNMEKDGYQFYDITECQFLEGKSGDKDVFANCHGVRSLQKQNMYVLSNKMLSYGAAGILNRRLLHDIIGEANCFIIPSSVHESIFILDTGELRQSELDLLVRVVNKTRVAEHERLSDHCYYYDGTKQEIRLHV